MDNSCIAAISTPIGAGGVAIIRISGEHAHHIADKVFKSTVSGKTLCNMAGYSATYGAVFDKDSNKLDECVATVFKAPHSYTGENVAELSVHGGVFVAQLVLRAVLDSGAVLAQRGEFTKRAFLNNKLDLIEAQAVMDIISANSKSSARAAISAKDGALSRRLTDIKDKLVSLASHLCAWADYPEEDIDGIREEELFSSLTHCKAQLYELLSTFEQSQAVMQGVDTVIAGRPNVGKSTLMNLLSGSEKSIVTDIPGTTRDVVESTVQVGNVLLNICDTAGLRESDNEIEKIGVEKTRARLSSCSLVIAVFDASESLTDDDLSIFSYSDDVKVIAVINKTDKESIIDIDKIHKNTDYVVFMSAKNAQGVDDFVRAVERVTNTANFDPFAAMLTNERQRTAVKDAYSSVENAIDELSHKVTYDCVTVLIEEAISKLLELSGERVSDTVVDSVFHNFCVGK